MSKITIELTEDQARWLFTNVLDVFELKDTLDIRYSKQELSFAKRIFNKLFKELIASNTAKQRELVR